jgi:hypothetical protein
VPRNYDQGFSGCTDGLQLTRQHSPFPS